MGAPGLVDHDAQRASRLGIIGSGQQQLGPADDHGQRIVELVAGPRGEFAQGIELALLEPQFLGLDQPGETTRRPTEPALQTARSATRAAHESQAPRVVAASEPAFQVRSFSVAPEVDVSPDAPVALERQRQGGGTLFPGRL